MSLNVRKKAGTAASLFGRGRPIVLFHKPTARCDCRCRFCDSWKDQPKQDDVLPTSEILSLLERAAGAGMGTYTVWGGEPFLVEPLGQWLSKAGKLGMQRVVCTSGSRLSERSSELAPRIDRLLLSLEAVGPAQDELRRSPGLYDRVVDGIEEFKRKGRDARITIWSNLSRLNMDRVDELAGFARERGVFIEFFPAALYPGYNEDSIMDLSERDRTFRSIMDLKKRGFPVINTWYGLELMRSGRPFRCNIPRLSVQVDSLGVARACESRIIADLEPYGRVDEIDFEALPGSAKYLGDRDRLSSCNACLLPCVANMADSIILQSLRKAGSIVYYNYLAGLVDKAR